MILMKNKPKSMCIATTNEIFSGGQIVKHSGLGADRAGLLFIKSSLNSASLGRNCVT
jgi:hypothetical protein